MKWGREQTQRWQRARREAYVAYLTALHQANEAMRAVFLGEHAADTGREMAARAAFRSAGVYQTREQVILVAPSRWFGGLTRGVLHHVEGLVAQAIRASDL